MGLPLVAKQFERLPKLCMQFVRAIPHNRQATTFGWTILIEGSNYNETARLNSMKYGSHIGLALFFTGKEVENCSIMPNIVTVLRKLKIEYIRLIPLHSCRLRSKPCAGCGQCST